MTPTKLRLGFTLALTFGLIPSAKAGSVSICDAIPGNLIQNCGFETGVTSNPPDWTTAQWLAGDDEIVTSPANSGSFALEIANDKGLPGLPLFNGAAIISQSFSDIAGATYRFTFYVFDAAGTNTSNQQFQAFWDSTAGAPLFVNTGGGTPASGYTQETFSVTGTGSDSITFTSYNTPSFYYLDDVSVVETAGASAVPEPSATMLTGGGVLLLLSIRLSKPFAAR